MRVVEASVELPVILRFKAVSVPEFVEDATFNPLIAKLFPVTFVNVVLANVDEAEATKFWALEVVALVVDASRVVICPLVAKRLVKEEVTIEIVFAKRFERTFRLVMEEVAAKIWLRAKLFPVTFVTVVLARVDEPVANKLIVFVVVALVIVALVEVIPKKFAMLANRFVIFAQTIDEEAIVDVAIVVVPFKIVPFPVTVTISVLFANNLTISPRAVVVATT